MKNGKRNIFFFAFLLFSLTIKAQQENTLPVREPDYNKPLLFAQLPDHNACTIDSLVSLLYYPVGKQVDRSIAANFIFKGEVTSVSNPDNNTITSITIRSSNYEGAILNLTAITGADKSTRYSCRIISLAHGDALELVKEGNQYFLIKKGFYDMINE